MRLYLSSDDLGNKPQRFAELLRGKKRVAIITNAGDYRSEEFRKERFEVRKSQLAAIGLEGFLLDLKKFFGKKDELALELKNYDAVLVTGGNTFLIRRAMHDSGFDEIIVPLLKEDKIVYGGWSAGVSMVTPDIHGIELMDQPEAVQEVYGKDLIWEAFNLVPYSMVCHYQSPDNNESPAAEKVVEYFKKENLNFKALSDGQVLIIDGDKEEMVQ
jgi:dipeptidase E